MKILVIQTAFIGDVILATTIPLALYDKFPDSEIHFLVRKGNESLLENFPGIKKVVIWDKKHNKLLNLFSILLNIRKEKYDVTINLQRFLSTGILTAFSKSIRKIGFDKNPLSYFFTDVISHSINENILIHETERNLKLVSPLIGSVKALPKLFPSLEEDKFVSIYKVSKYICIAPASVWFTKQFPKEKWIELINKLTRRYPEYSIYLLGGKNDQELCNQLISNSDHRLIKSLAGNLTFLQTAALMKDAIMNYVNDSAPLHIASATNAPVTVFYCSTIPEFGFGPLSSNQKIVEISAPLSCRPCGLHGHRKCPQGHFDCGYKIKLDFIDELSLI